MKLRYTGPVTVTFPTAGVGEVEPGAEFTVPDELTASFTSRSDIEEVTESSKAVARKKAAPPQIMEPDPLPVLVEAAPAETPETL